MPWFHPKTLLDKTYELGIFIKGIDGIFELLGGILVLAVPPRAVEHLVQSMTAEELSHDPHDFIATHILHYGNGLAHGPNLFVAAFLLTHGLTKVVIVACLLRNKLWAYPFALVAFSLFIAYQIYQMIVHLTVGMALLTALDAFIVWLIWREWQKAKAKRASGLITPLQ